MHTPRLVNFGIFSFPILLRCRSVDICKFLSFKVSRIILTWLDTCTNAAFEYSNCLFYADMMVGKFPLMSAERQVSSSVSHSETNF